MRNIPGTNVSIPLYFIEEEPLPLKPNLMRPFPRRELDFAKTIFSGQQSSARRTFEYALGLPSKRFGIFQKAFETNVEVTVYIQKYMFCVQLYKKNTSN